MNKQRLLDQAKSITQKIRRNKERGHSTDKLEDALNKVLIEAEKKNIKIKAYSL